MIVAFFCFIRSGVSKHKEPLKIYIYHRLNLVMTLQETSQNCQKTWTLKDLGKWRRRKRREVLLTFRG